jgi:hypothetical protein
MTFATIEKLFPQLDIALALAAMNLSVTNSKK